MGVVGKLGGEGGRSGLGVCVGIGVGGCCGGAGGGGCGVGVLRMRPTGRGFGVLSCCFALEVAAKEAYCAIGDNADGFAEAGARA